MDNGAGVSLWDQIVALVGAVVLWMTGETGRVLIASGAGGLVRWLAVEQKRIKTGIFAIIGGAIVGYYCWPLLLFVPAVWGGDVIEKTPETIAMAGFLAGTTGVSGVKIFIAVLEARAARFRGQDDAGE